MLNVRDKKKERINYIMGSVQFVTLETAKDVAKKLGDIGGGVLPYIPDDVEKSGIYIPEYGYFNTPSEGDKKFYHLRFKNGAEGFNAGLVANTMRLFPTRWPLMITEEVVNSATPLA